MNNDGKSRRRSRPVVASRKREPVVGDESEISVNGSVRAWPELSVAQREWLAAQAQARRRVDPGHA